MSFLIPVVKGLAYSSLPIILTRQIAVSNSFGRYYARIAVYVGTLFTVASCSVFIAAGLSLVGRSTDVNYFVARIFYGIISRALDLHIKVEGEEHLKTSPTVLMVNHQSMLDVFVIGRLMPKQTAIMAKKSLQYTPLGPFMSMSGTIFIDRGNSARAFRSIDAAGEKMKRDKTSLWMFPEGTRHLSEEPDMLHLKKGGFHLAINAGIPITPIVAENYWHMYRKGIFESGTMTVRVLPPIETNGFTVADVGVLSSRVRDEMMAALRSISPKVSTSEGTSQVSSSTKSEAEPLEPAVSLLSTSEPTLQSKASSSSLASSAMSSDPQKTTSSEGGNGTETEEDEGMILVGRPS